LDDEKRKLSVINAQFKAASCHASKEGREEAEDTAKECRRNIEEQQKRIRNYEMKIEKIKKQRILSRYGIKAIGVKKPQKEQISFSNQQQTWTQPLMQVLVWKYLCRIPLNIIVMLLETTYDVHISAGTLC